MDVSVVCRDALYSKEINKEKLDFTTKFWLCFTFQQRSSTFMSTESNQSE